MRTSTDYLVVTKERVRRHNQSWFVRPIKVQKDFLRHRSNLHLAVFRIAVPAYLPLLSRTLYFCSGTRHQHSHTTPKSLYSLRKLKYQARDKSKTMKVQLHARRVERDSSCDLLVDDRWPMSGKLRKAWVQTERFMAHASRREPQLRRVQR